VLVHVRDHLTVRLDVETHERWANGGDGRPDRVSEDADAERPEALLPPGAVAAGLRARARVHVVDDDSTELVDDQVHRPGVPPEQGRSGLARVERDAQGSREVIAGPERDQPQGVLRELVSPVQCRDDRVQAAVPAHDHDGSTPCPLEHAVELAGVAGDGDLHVGVLPEHAQGDVESLLATAPGVDVGDEQEGVHGVTLEAPGSGP
jgi:hypothetical protein